MSIYDELKTELEKIGDIKDFVLLTKFLKFTNGGDGLYQLNLIYKSNEKFRDCTNILLKFKNKLTIKQNKKGDVIGFAQFQDYIGYSLKELQQIKL